MKAVYFESDWPESPGEEILVTRVREDESDTDAILRAMELYSPLLTYYIKE